MVSKLGEIVPVVLMNRRIAPLVSDVVVMRWKCFFESLITLGFLNHRLNRQFRNHGLRIVSSYRLNIGKLRACNILTRLSINHPTILAVGIRLLDRVDGTAVLRGLKPFFLDQRI